MSDAQETTTTTTASTTGAGGDAGGATGEGETEITSMITAPAEGAGEASKTETTENKSEGTPAADAKADDKPYTIEVPEKYAQYVDKAALEKFAALAKEAGVTKEQAEKIAAFDFERRANEVRTQDELVTKQSAAWLDQIKKDPEFGGDKLAATQNNVLRAFAKFGDAATSKQLVQLGMENHPGLVRMLAKVGAALAEDSGTIKGAGAAKPPARNWIYD